MKQRVDLTTGSIPKKLVKLALPIMGVSFIQTAYNLIDMIWIGKVGSGALAAVGTAGFFTWLAEAFILVPKLGASIKVAHSMGEANDQKAKQYILGALQLNIVLALLYSLFLIMGHQQLIAFFNLNDAAVESMANTYLVTVGIGMLFFFSGPVFTGIFNGLGDSRTPFIINTIGLIFNMIFDPVLIFGIGIFPEMGVLGAALATVIAQIIVTTCFIVIIIRKKIHYISLKIWQKPQWDLIKELSIIGLPGAIQSGLYTMFSMVLGRIVAWWGPNPIAAQKVGSQIEAISWLTAGGFSTAVSAYVGQNYGANKTHRIEKGVRITMMICCLVGTFSTVLLIGAGEPLMQIFTSDSDTINIGKHYLTILGFSQLFMCIEITITGVFSGLGRTYLPNTITILLTGLRIPLALLLSQQLGLNGVWWSISLTSIMKGTLLAIVYCVLNKRGKLLPEHQGKESLV